MIKLESNIQGLAVKSLISLESPTETPSIGLSTRDAKKLIDGQWIVDPTKRRQMIAFHAEGQPVELSGAVPEPEAVEIAAAWKVVVEVEVSSRGIPAMEAGRLSRSVISVEVCRVLEIWEAPAKCLWKSKSTVQAGGKVMTPDGKIVSK